MELRTSDDPDDLNRNVAKKISKEGEKKGGWKENMEIGTSQGRWEDDGLRGCEMRGCPSPKGV